MVRVERHHFSFSMADTVFRTPIKSSETAQQPVAPADPKTISTTKVEVPYLDYKAQHVTPFVVDHYGIGDRWSDPVGGFPKEVEAIESYFRDQIESGEMANSQKAVKDRLKEIEKVTNMSKEERNVIKLEVIAEYVKFLSKTNDIKKNITRYANA